MSIGRKNREAVFHADYSRFAEVDGVPDSLSGSWPERRAAHDPDSRVCLVESGVEQSVAGTGRGGT